MGQFHFDFRRFGVRIPAILISPRIEAGTVFRNSRGTIDHTSVLKTIELRWGTQPLTARVDNAPDLGDVLTRAVPRTDDPLKDVQIPISNLVHQNLSRPSLIEKLHADRVADLPLRNDRGTYDQHIRPDLSTSAAIAEYIQYRTAAWKDHLERLRDRRLSQRPSAKRPREQNTSKRHPQDRKSRRGGPTRPK
jgi:phospholipase C